MLPPTAFYKPEPISKRLKLAGMLALLLTALLTIAARVDLVTGRRRPVQAQ